MKLSPRDAARYFAKPEAQRTGVLIYGTDPMRVALKRQEFLKNRLGPNAEEEMRLSRMPAGELRRDPAMLLDAIKAVGFFPGGLGLREAIIAVLSPVIGLPFDTGVLLVVVGVAAGMIFRLGEEVAPA